MDSRIYMLVHKELTGEMTPSEAKELNLFRKEEGGVDLAQDVSLIWNVSKDYFPRKDWNKGAAKAQFLNKIHAEKTVSAVPQPSKVTPNYTRFLKIGVAILGLAFISYCAITYLSSLTDDSGVEQIEIKTKANIEYATLPDNTQFWLGPSSTISDVVFTENSRSITLTGEALFDVTHDVNRPFKINLGKGVNIEVLGTSFKASSSDMEGRGVVVVRDGKVRLYSSVGKKNTAIIRAGETGELNAVTEYINSYDTSTEITLGDIQNLSLKNLPLEEAFGKLSKHFGINFDVTSAKMDCRFNSTLLGNQTIAEIIESITATYPNLKFTLESRSTYKVSGSCG